MPAKRVKLVGTRPSIETSAIVTPGVGRAMSETVAAVRRLEAQVKSRTAFVVDLVVGDNRIAHQLGQAPKGASVSPTVTDATFAWAMTDADETVAVIETVGVDQPGAGVEFYV